jgi:hypothetical protein
VVIPDCQFIKKMRQVISIRYASTRIVINFIKNTHISTLRIMHPLGGGQLLRRLPIKIISGTFIGSSIQLFHWYYLHELAGHPRLVFLQSPPRFCFPIPFDGRGDFFLPQASPPKVPGGPHQNAHFGRVP